MKLAAILAWALAAAPAAQWKILGPGGGGAQALPTISPHDPGTVLVTSNMTGAYITHDSGASWRMFNLRGSAGFFAFDPIDPKTIYAQTNTWAYTMGLWRSTDSGRTWRLVYPDPSSVVRIDMPHDIAIERVITREGPSSIGVTGLAIDPSDSKTLYAVLAARGGPAALHISKDWGKTWRKLADFTGGGLAARLTSGNQTRKIYVDPRTHAAYVIGANSVGVYRDGVWKPGDPAPGVSVFTDASAGFVDGRLVVYGVDAGGYHVSGDGGQTWRNGAVVAGAAPRLSGVATSLHHPEAAYIGYSLRGEQSFFGVARTADFGKTWDLVWKESRTASANMHDGWLTERFGPGWGSDNFSLGVSPNDPNLCYVTNMGKTLRTADGGRTWYGVYSKQVPGGVTSTGLDVTTCYGVHFDPFDRKRLFITYTDIGLFGSEDGGISWNSVTRTAPQRWNNTTYWMEFDPEVRGRAWAVMSGYHDLPRSYAMRGSAARFNGGVAVSDDGARTWRVAGDSLPPSAVTHILLDPASPAQARVLYVTAFGRGVFKTVDGGRAWVLKNEGIETTDPLAWRLARDSKGTLYLVVARHSDDGSFGGDGDGALYRSTDGAEHWRRLLLPKGVNGPNGVAIDPADPARLYLAVWGRSAEQGAADGGIFLSTDGGRNWRNVLSRDQHIYDVTADPRDPRVLYAAGFESSAWRSKNRGETWERIRGFNFKRGHRVIPDPYNAKMIYITTFGGSVWYGPADGDARAVEDIVSPEVAYGR